MFKKNQKLSLNINIQLDFDLCVSTLLALGINLQLIINKANRSIINLFFYGIDHHDILTSQNVPSVHLMWLPLLSSFNYPLLSELYNNIDSDDWMQVDEYFIFGYKLLDIEVIGDISIKHQLFKYQQNRDDVVNEKTRISNQLSFIHKYLKQINQLNLPVIDLGAGDGDLSFRLSEIIDKYIPMDIKLGFTQIGVQNTIISMGMEFIILARNSFHHIQDIGFLDQIPNCKGILVIDYFGLATVSGSLYHHVYSEFVYFRSIQNICFNLPSFNSVKRLDDVNYVTGPTAYYFSKFISRPIISEFNMIKFDYDNQFVNNDMSIIKFNRDKVVFQSGMLRVLQDYFFPSRFELSGGSFKYSDFNNIKAYVDAVGLFVADSKEVKPDDIFMWYKVILDNNYFNVMSDPFAGWFSRGIAFALAFWNDASSIFYWYDIDHNKCNSIVKVISYLVDSGCKVNFIRISQSTNASRALILISPFYINFEKVGGLVNNFQNADEWADYIISFVFSKIGTLYPFIIQIDNYKGYDMKDALVKRFGFTTNFTMCNDLVYYKKEISFISCLYNDKLKPRFYADGLVRSLLTIYEDKNKDILNIFGLKCYVECDGVIFNSSTTYCGHYASRSVYRGVRWHHGQLKLLCLLYIVAKSLIKPSVIIYLGSGNHTSYLTNYGISHLSSSIIFILVDKYSQQVKMFGGNRNIRIYNGFLTEDTLHDVLSLYSFKSTDSVLVLSDIRREKYNGETHDEYVINRGTEFEDELILLRKIKANLRFTKEINFCLKINYSKVDYMIPDGDLFYIPFIDTELRLITDLSGSVEMTTSKFDVVYKDLFNSCFEGGVCFMCHALKLIIRHIQ